MSAPVFKGDYQKQRRLTVALVVAFLIGLWVASVVGYQWALSGSAQQPGEPTSGLDTAAATATTRQPGNETEDPTAFVQAGNLEGRLEELSRSQDRLVQEVLAITALLGTAFIVLLGLNVWQSNRNFERESAHIREYAEFRITSAVDQSEAELAAIVEAAARRTDEQMEASRSNVLKQLLDEREKSRADLNAVAASANQAMINHLAGLSVLIRWSVEQTRTLMREAANAGETDDERKLAWDLFQLSLTALDLYSTLADTELLEYGLLSMRLSLQSLMQGHVVPEELSFWYDHPGGYYRRVKDIVERYKLSDKYRRTAEEIDALVPTSPQSLKADQLKRLIERRAP